ncbi:hypothetical protein [Antrihabitans spumae]|uniref:Uncharacterized protein n=1 Tax=Antrihabitans spumae TaxID=3373370 RepID=A0ABW7KCW4_9NOCA
MAITRLTGGWVRYNSEYQNGKRTDYWLDGFPAGTTDDERRRGRGVDKRISPILDYDARGIGPIEWINATHDRAVILAADGGWHQGGEFHVWYSAGGSTLPREITPHVIFGPRIVSGDNVGWQEQLDQAVQQVQDYLGIDEVD